MTVAEKGLEIFIFQLIESSNIWKVNLAIYKASGLILMNLKLRGKSFMRSKKQKFGTGEPLGIFFKADSHIKRQQLSEIQLSQDISAGSYVNSFP